MRAFPRTWRRTLLAAGAVVLFFAAVALSAHDVIERLLLEHALGRALGGTVSIGGLRHDGGVTRLAALHARTADGALTFDAVELAYARRGGNVQLRPRGLRVTVALDAAGPPDLVRLREAAAVLGARSVGFRLTGATAAFVHAADPAKRIDVKDVGGEGVLGGCCARYDLTFAVVGADGAFPGSAHAATTAGRMHHTWTAPVLPVATLGAFLPTDAVTLTAGTANDVEVRANESVTAKMTLRGVTALVGKRELRALSGPLVVTPDGIGSPDLDAELAGKIPLGFSGEVHGIHAWPLALTAGTRDFRMLGWLLDSIAAQPRLRWVNLETTAPGIVYGQYAMSANEPKTVAAVPHVVQLIAVDPNEPTVRFDTALADDHIVSHGERTTDLGIRTKAVAGVNGDYFDIGRTYEPQGLLMKSGVLLHGPTDHAALVIDKHNRPTFAVFHFHGNVTSGGHVYPLTQYNSWPIRDGTIITPEYGKTLPPADGVTFLALRPLGGRRYRVTSAEKAVVPIPVRFGVAFGRDVREPLPKPGAVVEMSYAVDPPVDGAVAAIGSGPRLLENGAWFEDKRAPAPDERDVQWPVIAVGVLPDQTLVFASVDGRHPERSIGMTRPEFAELLRRFGVTDAMALDSGGSVTMVARSPGSDAVSLHNAPSDNSLERYIADALFVYSSAPRATIVSAPRPHVEPTPGAARP